MANVNENKKPRRQISKPKSEENEQQQNTVLTNATNDVTKIAENNKEQQIGEQEKEIKEVEKKVEKKEELEEQEEGIEEEKEQEENIETTKYNSKETKLRNKLDGAEQDYLKAKTNFNNLSTEEQPSDKKEEKLKKRYTKQYAKNKNTLIKKRKSILKVLKNNEEKILNAKKDILEKISKDKEQNISLNLLKTVTKDLDKQDENTINNAINTYKEINPRRPNLKKEKAVINNILQGINKLDSNEKFDSEEKIKCKENLLKAIGSNSYKKAKSSASIAINLIDNIHIDNDNKHVKSIAEFTRDVATHFKKNVVNSASEKKTKKFANKLVDKINSIDGNQKEKNEAQKTLIKVIDKKSINSYRIWNKISKDNSITDPKVAGLFCRKFKENQKNKFGKRHHRNRKIFDNIMSTFEKQNKEDKGNWQNDIVDLAISINSTDRINKLVLSLDPGASNFTKDIQQIEDFYLKKSRDIRIKNSKFDNLYKKAFEGNDEKFLTQKLNDCAKEDRITNSYQKKAIFKAARKRYERTDKNNKVNKAFKNALIANVKRGKQLKAKIHMGKAEYCLARAARNEQRIEELKQKQKDYIEYKRHTKITLNHRIKRREQQQIKYMTRYELEASKEKIKELDKQVKQINKEIKDLEKNKKKGKIKEEEYNKKETELKNKQETIKKELELEKNKKRKFEELSNKTKNTLVETTKQNIQDIKDMTIENEQEKEKNVKTKVDDFIKGKNARDEMKKFIEEGKENYKDKSEQFESNLAELQTKAKTYKEKIKEKENELKNNQKKIVELVNQGKENKEFDSKFNQLNRERENIKKEMEDLKQNKRKVKKYIKEHIEEEQYKKYKESIVPEQYYIEKINELKKDINELTKTLENTKQQTQETLERKKNEIENRMKETEGQLQSREKELQLREEKLNKEKKDLEKQQEELEKKEKELNNNKNEEMEKAHTNSKDIKDEDQTETNKKNIEKSEQKLKEITRTKEELKIKERMIKEKQDKTTKKKKENKKSLNEIKKIEQKLPKYIESLKNIKPHNDMGENKKAIKNKTKEQGISK